VPYQGALSESWAVKLHKYSDRIGNGAMLSEKVANFPRGTNSKNFHLRVQD
jgi:hypothetical protein